MSKSRDRNAEKLIKWDNDLPYLRIRVKGPFAIFSDPCYTERVSYDVITPSAADGLIRNIYSHPGMKIMIDKIHVLNPIRKESIKENGSHTKLTMTEVMKFYKDENAHIQRDGDGSGGRLQFTLLRLIDVEYIIEFHLDIDARYANSGDSAQKFAYILADRLSRGACFEHPYLGIREYCCDVLPINKEETLPVSSIKGTYNLGMMFYGWDKHWESKTMDPILFNPVMKNGVIDVSKCELYKKWVRKEGDNV